MITLYLAVSDIHLGNDNTQYDTFNEFLKMAAKDAKGIIFCGDTLECWVSTLDQIQHYEPMKTSYELLLETSQKIPLLLLTGNHDYNIAGKVPFIVTNNYKQDNIYFVHGHFWDLYEWALFPFFSEIIQYFPSFYQHYIYKPNYLKTGVGTTCAEINNVAFDYAIKHKCKVVFGHTHFPSVTNNVVYNCGDFLEHCTYVQIEDEGKQIKLKKM